MLTSRARLAALRHPAASWVTFADGMLAAHRAHPHSDDKTRCGLPGMLVAAGRDKPRCDQCYPPRPVRVVMVRREVSDP